MSLCLGVCCLKVGWVVLRIRINHPRMEEFKREMMICDFLTKHSSDEKYRNDE